MNLTPQLIRDSITLVPTQSDEVLSHTYKALLTSAKPAELKQLEPFMASILKELRSRHKPLPKEVPLDEQPARHPDQDTDN